MKVEAWFDGCCEPINPGGHAAFGALVKVDGVVTYSEGRYVGHGQGISNNVAEYSGAIAVMEHILSLQSQNWPPRTSVTIRGDSKLVIEQMAGNWKAKQGAYIPFFKKAKDVKAKLKGRVRFEWISRDFNDECDFLSKQVLREKNVKFRIQPEN
jgi:ribonuclease HI